MNNGANANWEKLPAPERTEERPYQVEVLNDGSLLVLYLARREDSGFTKSSGLFLYKDGEWTDLTPKGTSAEYYACHFQVSPHDSTQNTIYLTSRKPFGGSLGLLASGVWVLKNKGKTWTNIYSDIYGGVASFKISPYDENEGYLCTEGNGLFKTQNLTSENVSFEQDTSFTFINPTQVFYHEDKIWVLTYGNGCYFKDNEVTQGVNNILVKDVLEVYPNPVKDNMIVDLSGFTGNVTLSVYDLNGRVVQEVTLEGNRTTNLKISQFQNGIYYIVAKGMDRAAFIKIMVINGL